MISEQGKKFFDEMSASRDVAEIVDSFAFSERIMISVDLEVLKDFLLKDVRELLDGVGEFGSGNITLS